MAKTRITHKKKVYNADNRDIWIVVERLDKLIIETGRGFQYQKVIYNFIWTGEQDDGTWDNSESRTTIKRITNPDDDSQYVDLPVIDRVTVERGRGAQYQKTVHHFDNTEANMSRVVHTKTVHGSENPDDRLDVEVIEKLTREVGRAQAYQLTKVTYNDQGEEAT